MTDAIIPRFHHQFIPGDGRNVFREKFGSLSDDEWGQVLARSIGEPVIDDVAFPKFPEEETQNAIHGNSPRSTLTLTEDNSTALGTSLPATFGALFYDDAYNETSSLSKLAGNWILSTGAFLSINSGGTLASKDPANGCAVNGKVTMINEKYNAYAVAATYSNCSASASALNDLNATGLVTLDDTQNPAVLYIGYSMTLSNGEVLMISANGTGG